jgi:hypothetical protein
MLVSFALRKLQSLKNEMQRHSSRTDVHMQVLPFLYDSLLLSLINPAFVQDAV